MTAHTVLPEMSRTACPHCGHYTIESVAVVAGEPQPVLLDADHTPHTCGDISI